MKGKFYDGIWETKLLSKAIADFRGKHVAGEVHPLCGGDREILEHIIMEWDWYEEEKRTLDNQIKQIVEEIWEEKRGEDGAVFYIGF